MKKIPAFLRIAAFVLVTCLCAALVPVITFAEDPVSETVHVINRPDGFATQEPVHYPANGEGVNWVVTKQYSSGYSDFKVNGAGYIDFNNCHGYINFTINAETSGEYYVAVGYASGGNRKFDVAINSVSAGTLTCNSNGGYQNPASYHLIKTTLNAGSNTVTVSRPESYGSSGAPCVTGVMVFPVGEWLSYSAKPTLGGTASATAKSNGIDGYGYAAGSSTGTVTWNVTVPVAGTYKVMIPYIYASSDANAVTVLANGTSVATVGENTITTSTGWKFLTTGTFTLEAGASVPLTLSWSGNKVLGGIRLQLVEAEDTEVDSAVLDDLLDGVSITNYTSVEDVKALLNQLLWEYTLEVTLQTKATATTEGLYKMKVTLPDSTEYTRDFAIPKVPSLDYYFELPVVGMAQGTVLVTLPDKDVDGNYSLYWGTEDGLLDGYTYLAPKDDLKAGQNTLRFKVRERVMIPAEATHLWLLLDGTRVTSYEIPAARRTTLGNLKYSFGATADTHLFGAGDENNQKYAAAMDLFASANADFALVAGDVVGSATQSYWDDFNNINANYDQPVFIVPGNHDVLYYWNGSDNGTNIDKMINSVPTYGKEDFAANADGKPYKVTKGDTAVDYTVEYGDDLFVYLGVGLVDFTPEDKKLVTEQHLTLDQINWLKKVFATADDYENVFLVFHYAAFESGFATYDGSDWSMDWSWEHNGYMTEGYSSAEELYKILKDHPNVIAFSGHTHRDFNGDQNLTVTKTYDFNYENYTWTQGTDPLGFTAVHIPSSQKYQAYVTYVYDNGVLLSGYDTSTGDVVSHANFWLPNTIDSTTQEMTVNAPATANVGDVIPLSVKGNSNVAWTILDGKELASIDAAGNLKINGSGTIVLKASSVTRSVGLTAETVVSISSQLNIPVEYVCVGKGVALTLDGFENVSWSALNEDGSATVDENGILTAHKAGVIQLKATIVDPATGLAAESTTTVTAVEAYRGDAEYATVNGSVGYVTNSAGVNFFDFSGVKPGRGVNYPIFVDKAGEYNASLSYCLGSNSDRRMSVSVNGTVVLAEVKFSRSSTSGWGSSGGTFGKQELCLPLEEGLNIVTLSEVGGYDGSPQLADLIVHKPYEGSVQDATPIGAIKTVGTGANAYFDFQNNMSGQGATYTVYADEAGEYYMAIGFRVGSNAQRALNLSVNGSTAERISFHQNSNKWSGGIISYRIVPVTLKEGKNEITLMQIGSEAAPQMTNLICSPAEEWFTETDVPTLDGAEKLTADYGIDGTAYRNGTVAWNVNVPKAGTYRISAAYSAIENASIDVLVNGTKLQTLTGAASSYRAGNGWELVTTDELELSAGQAVLALQASNGVQITGLRLELVESEEDSLSNDLTVKIEEYDPAGKVYSLDLLWENDDMAFDYNAGSEGTWNPQDHTFEGAVEEKWEDKDLKITVVNHSNNGVKAALTVTDTDEDDELLVTPDATEKTLPTAEGTTVENAPMVDFILTIDGTPAGAVTNVATVTVSFTAAE